MYENRRLDLLRSSEPRSGARQLQIGARVLAVVSNERASRRVKPIGAPHCGVGTESAGRCCSERSFDDEPAGREEKEKGENHAVRENGGQCEDGSGPMGNKGDDGDRQVERLLGEKIGKL